MYKLPKNIWMYKIFSYLNIYEINKYRSISRFKLWIESTIKVKLNCLNYMMKYCDFDKKIFRENMENLVEMIKLKIVNPYCYLDMFIKIKNSDFLDFIIKNICNYVLVENDGYYVKYIYEKIFRSFINIIENNLDIKYIFYISDKFREFIIDDEIYNYTYMYACKYNHKNYIEWFDRYKEPFSMTKTFVDIRNYEHPFYNVMFGNMFYCNVYKFDKNMNMKILEENKSNFLIWGCWHNYECNFFNFMLENFVYPRTEIDLYVILDNSCDKLKTIMNYYEINDDVLSRALKMTLYKRSGHYQAYSKLLLSFIDQLNCEYLEEIMKNIHVVDDINVVKKIHKLCLEYSIKVNLDKCLFLSIQNGCNNEIIKYYIEQSANINIYMNNIISKLNRSKDVKIVIDLINEYSDIHIYKDNLLQICIKNNFLKLSKILYNHYNATIFNTLNSEFLLSCIRDENKLCLKWLIKNMHESEKHNLQYIFNMIPNKTSNKIRRLLYYNLPKPSKKYK